MKEYLQLYFSDENRELRALEQKIILLQNLEARSASCGFSSIQQNILKQWTGQIVDSQKKKLSEIVLNFRSYIRISIEHINLYKDLLNEIVCRQFIRTIYKNLLVYDVPTFSYILQTISSIKTEAQTVIANK